MAYLLYVSVFSVAKRPEMGGHRGTALALSDVTGVSCTSRSERGFALFDRTGFCASSGVSFRLIVAQ
jgi:hypothetical protein